MIFNISIFNPISTKYLFTRKKIAIVSVINDLASDNRVQKTCRVLIECNFEVLLVGRRLPNSPLLPDGPFQTHRIKLLFIKGPLFYLFFNLRLFFFLFFKKVDLLYANDLDTLLPNFLISKLKKLPLIYDSHELFCEVPELIHSPLKKMLWEKLEGFIVPKLKHCITVNESIAEIFQKKYSVGFLVVRNIPETFQVEKTFSRSELGLPLDKKIILLQGAGINVDRGSEELVEAMRFTENCLLLIIGSGDVWPLLEEKVKAGLQEKVLLIQRIPREKLLQYTINCDLGISIDKNTNLNYYYSLPNKLFDYIHAGLPILASKLPEIEKIVTMYRIGDFIDTHEPKHIAQKIMKILQSEDLITYRNNALLAREQLNWAIEKQPLEKMIKSL